MMSLTKMKSNVAPSSYWCFSPFHHDPGLSFSLAIFAHGCHHGNLLLPRQPTSPASASSAIPTAKSPRKLASSSPHQSPQPVPSSCSSRVPQSRDACDLSGAVVPLRVSTTSPCVHGPDPRWASSLSPSSPPLLCLAFHPFLFHHHLLGPFYP